MKKRLSVTTSADNYVKTYLQLFNGVFSLTPREQKALELFISIDPERAATKQARKLVKEQMGFNSYMAVNNLVSSLKSKGAILKSDNGGYIYHTLLNISHKPNEIQIVINGN